MEPTPLDMATGAKATEAKGEQEGKATEVADEHYMATEHKTMHVP